MAMSTVRVPILTYHGNGINGTGYADNDLVAFRQDLQLLRELGWQVISMDELFRWYDGQLEDEQMLNKVVLTCDDGTWFDFYDLDHPSCGPQQSLYSSLQEHQKLTSQPVHMTNFVIVSPAAREVLDQQCLIGHGWWGDDWWLLAQQSGLMSIANHSWDHNHGLFDNNNSNDDTFIEIDDLAGCDRQIKQAQAFLRDKMGADFHCPYFAYPYGDYSEYLKTEYLPGCGKQLGLVAAFTTENAYVSRQTDRWAMPRFVCNHHWKSVEQLADILLSA
jgi:hypothetical protein